MATPNNAPNADSGIKSITRLLWRNRKSLSKQDKKSSKDVWDIIDIIARGVIALLTVVAAIAIPIVVAKIGGKIQQAVTSQTGKIQESIATQNTGKDYMQLALEILKKKDLPEDMQKNIGLRTWAVGLLKHYSPVTLDEPTADKLINGEVEIPVVYGNSQQLAWGPPDPSSAFQAVAPHHHGFASLNTDGVLILLTGSGRYTVHTHIKSPKGVFFTLEGAMGSERLVVFNNQTFAIYFTELDPRGHLMTPIEISPPNGISSISDNLSGIPNTIIVTGTDKKQILYDYDGNEIKQ